MVTRALVLGGGGTIGIAWETGLLAGLARAGIDLGRAERIVGTSAGSVVGAQLALGLPLEQMLAQQLAPLDPGYDRPIAVDPQQFMALAQLLMQGEANDPNLLARIGQFALSATTVDEASYLERFAVLRDVPWPARDLRITSIDTANGALQVWTRDSNVPLQLAVAASCAVPGIFPPVTINGRRYMDGGMRSDTNADLAQDAAIVLIVKPIPSQGLVPGMSRAPQLTAEVERLRAAGSRVEVIEPDGAALAAFGTDLMDVTRRQAVAEAALRQAQQVAERVHRFWQG
ncbi:patatin-like phospholipase family protein [Kallotenue papyrolyticum]|uniref:patatin-like phospholipase family protein n=1 Tax=Kallotenue papyrolyticum TaxID=1325125 RepID=UPI000478528A|nr:patatin-like phospholipase family protein [Kallotenue papyrolyticum]